MIRILVVTEDEQHLQTLLQSMLPAEVSLRGGRHLIQVLPLIEGWQADLLLVDVDRLGLRDQGSLLAIRDTYPKLVIVGFSDQPPFEARRRAFRFCLQQLIAGPGGVERIFERVPSLLPRPG